METEEQKHADVYEYFRHNSEAIQSCTTADRIWSEQKVLHALVKVLQLEFELSSQRGVAIVRALITGSAPQLPCPPFPNLKGKEYESLS